jgi:hypothetical protein
MRTLLCSWLLLATASVAVAQTPTQGAPGAPTVYGMQSVNPTVQPPSHLVMPQAQAPSTYGPQAAQVPCNHTYGTPSSSHTDCCSPSGCAPCGGCVREPATKKITHTFYCKGCEEFCIPVCCCCLSSLFGCSSCEGPYTRYYLVKKVRFEECPTTKCVPVAAPCCGPAQCK